MVPAESAEYADIVKVVIEDGSVIERWEARRPEREVQKSSEQKRRWCGVVRGIHDIENLENDELKHGARDGEGNGEEDHRPLGLYVIVLEKPRREEKPCKGEVQA